MNGWNVFFLGFILGGFSIVALVVGIFAFVRRATGILR